MLKRNKEELKAELKRLIVETLKLADVDPASIDDHAPLFGEGLGLDSIDALELTVALERTYKAQIPDEEVGKRAFANVDAMATFLLEQ